MGGVELKTLIGVKSRAQEACAAYLECVKEWPEKEPSSPLSGDSIEKMFVERALKKPGCRKEEVWRVLLAPEGRKAVLTGKGRTGKTVLLRMIARELAKKELDRVQGHEVLIEGAKLPVYLDCAGFKQTSDPREAVVQAIDDQMNKLSKDLARPIIDEARRRLDTKCNGFVFVFDNVALGDPPPALMALLEGRDCDSIGIFAMKDDRSSKDDRTPWPPTETVPVFDLVNYDGGRIASFLERCPPPVKIGVESKMKSDALFLDWMGHPLLLAIACDCSRKGPSFLPVENEARKLGLAPPVPSSLGWGWLAFWVALALISLIGLSVWKGRRPLLPISQPSLKPSLDGRWRWVEDPVGGEWPLLARVVQPALPPWISTLPAEPVIVDFNGARATIRISFKDKGVIVAPPARPEEDGKWWVRQAAFKLKNDKEAATSKEVDPTFYDLQFQAGISRKIVEFKGAKVAFRMTDPGTAERILSFGQDSLWRAELVVPSLDYAQSPRIPVALIGEWTWLGEQAAGAMKGIVIAKASTFRIRKDAEYELDLHVDITGSVDLHATTDVESEILGLRGRSVLVEDAITFRTNESTTATLEREIPGARSSGTGAARE